MIHNINKKDELYALKTVSKKEIIKSPKKRELFFIEIKQMKRLNHENICKLYETFEDKLNCYLLLEYCNEGDLAQ